MYVLHARTQPISATRARLIPTLAIFAATLAACSESSRISSPEAPTVAALAKGPKALPTRGPLLFSTMITGMRDLYSVNEDGTNVKRLTFSPAHDDHAAYSPDGSKIAFISERTGRTQLYIMNSDGTGVKQITSFVNDFNFAGEPTWSPDGKKLALGLKDFTAPVVETHVYLMSLNGTSLTKLTSDGSINFNPTFSPDGQRIAFASDREDPAGELDIWIMNIDGTNPTRLTSCVAGYHCRKPKWSTDGSKIAVEVGDPTLTSIMVLNANTKLMVFSTAMGFSDPFWSPDGIKLAMVHKDGITHQLRTVNANGSTWETVLEWTASQMRGLSWGR